MGFEQLCLIPSLLPLSILSQSIHDSRQFILLGLRTESLSYPCGIARVRSRNINSWIGDCAMCVNPFIHALPYSTHLEFKTSELNNTLEKNEALIVAMGIDG